MAGASQKDLGARLKMGVTLKIRNLDRLPEIFDAGLGARPTINVNLSVSGPAAAYSLIWEFGRADINPGPKTLWSTNYYGETKVLTKTAPNGFIRINREKYRQFIREELARISWKKIKFKNIPKYVQEALERAAERCAELIAETAPYDTGALYEAIKSVSVVAGTEDSLSIRTRMRAIK